MTTLIQSVPQRKSFSAHNPWLQIAWDSTSLGEAKTCWRKYALGIVLGFQPRHMSHHLRYGQLYHRVLEVYDHKTFEGMSHDEAQHFMLRDLAEGCQDLVPDDNVSGLVQTTEDFTSLLDAPVAKNYSVDSVVQQDTNLKRVWWDPNEFLSDAKAAANAKTIPNLFRTAVWYTERFRNDTLRTVRLANGKPAVELSFRFELGSTNAFGEQLLYCGHLDRLAVDEAGSQWVVDRKTTGSTIGFGFFNQYNPDNQMSGYTVGAHVTLGVPAKGVIIDAVQIAKGFSRFERGYANRSQAQLDEWLSTTTFYITTLAAAFAQKANDGAGIDAFPMNDKACHNYNGCQFRDQVCSKDPRMRQAFLEGNFKRRFWDPLEVRGDI